MRIKKLDLYLLKSFIGPFIITFFVVLFALVMQNLWLYMDEILGKGLSVWVITQYLLSFAAIMTPMAMPLALLLTGIMTFGTLGENFELAAIKSAGISLVRFMRPLTVFAIAMSALSFVINNYVSPFMNLKTYSLLYDMRKQRPALNLEEGVFNTLFDGFSIRIGRKDQNGYNIKDVLIYDHKSDVGNKNVIIADSGKILPSEDGKYLVFELYNGWRYEESGDPVDKDQTRMQFRVWNKIFDLSKFKFQRTEEDLFKNNEKMMNVGELKSLIDSMEIQKQKNFTNAKKDLGNYISILDSTKYSQLELVNNTSNNSYQKSYLEVVPDSLHLSVINYAEGYLKTSKSLLFNSLSDEVYNNQRQLKLDIELQQKFSMAIACIILFLIGAPLGGIIRKGGIGMPVVVGIVFFVLYFILNTTGVKLAKEETVPTIVGVWMATYTLIPIALLIILQAKNDSKLVSGETYKKIWIKVKDWFLVKILKKEPSKIKIKKAN